MNHLSCKSLKAQGKFVGWVFGTVSADWFVHKALDPLNETLSRPICPSFELMETPR